jgi:hypothetical protein
MDCNNDSDLNGMDKRDLVVVLLVGSPVYNCYSRSDFRKILKAEFEKGICEYSGEKRYKITASPVIKEPYFGVFVDKSIIAFQHHDCFVLYGRRDIRLYSEFGVGSIHGSVHPVYSAYPVSLVTFVSRSVGVREFVDTVVESITPPVAERMDRDVDFILRGGDIDFVGATYQRKLAKAVEKGVLRDYIAEERVAEDQANPRRQQANPWREEDTDSSLSESESGSDSEGSGQYDIISEIRQQVTIVPRSTVTILNDTPDNPLPHEGVEKLVLFNCTMSRLGYYPALRMLTIKNCRQFTEISSDNQLTTLSLIIQPTTSILLPEWVNRLEQLSITGWNSAGSYINSMSLVHPLGC